MIQLPIEIGDVIRVGRFKNKRVTVKDISVDEYGLPLVNGRGILKIRIEKLMPKQEIKENIMSATDSIRIVLDFIKSQIGLTLTPDSHFSGIKRSNGKKYFNVILKSRVSESEEFNQLDRFSKKSRLLRIEPNGINRVAIFFDDSILKKTNTESKAFEENTMKNLTKEGKPTFGNDNPLLPGSLKKGQKYLHKDGKIVTFTGERTKDDFKVTYEFSVNGRGNYGLTHDEVLDNITLLESNRNLTKEGLQKLIKSTIKELHETDTQVKIKQVDGRWRICQADTDHYLDNNGYETKELAQHAALTKGYSYSGVEEELPDTVEVPKPTKREKTKGTDKPEELKLGKETERKLESIIRKVIKEEISTREAKKPSWRTARSLSTSNRISAVNAKKYVHDKLGLDGSTLNSPVIIYTVSDDTITYRLKGEDGIKTMVIESVLKKRINEADVTGTDLESDLIELARLSDEMDAKKAELKELENKFKPLDDKFRQILEAMDETQDNFLRVKKLELELLVSVKRKGYDREDYKYKEAYLLLKSKVNPKMKKMMEDFLEFGETLSGEKIKTITRVKSSLGVQRIESRLKEENFLSAGWSKLKNFFNKSLQMFTRRNQEISNDINKLEKMVGK